MELDSRDEKMGYKIREAQTKKIPYTLVLGNNERDNNTIMVHIRHLREKMNDGGRNPKYIKTVYGMGYKIEK